MFRTLFKINIRFPPMVILSSISRVFFPTIRIVFVKWKFFCRRFILPFSFEAHIVCPTASIRHIILTVICVFISVSLIPIYYFILGFNISFCLFLRFSLRPFAPRSVVSKPSSGRFPTIFCFVGTLGLLGLSICISIFDFLRPGRHLTLFHPAGNRILLPLSIERYVACRVKCIARRNFCSAAR